MIPHDEPETQPAVNETQPQVPPTSGKSGLGGSVPEGAWRKFHKVTPLAQGGALWVVLAIFVYNVVTQIIESGLTEMLERVSDITLTFVLAILGALLALTLIVIFFSWISWRYQSFAIIDSGIHKRSGVLLKNHSHMRWDRIQTVEIEQKLFGRIFGFGSVKVESAGSEPATELGLLTMEDCGKLRREILTGLGNARAGRPIGVGVPVSAVVGANTVEAIPEGAGVPLAPDSQTPPDLDNMGAAALDCTGMQSGTQSGEIPVFDPDDLETDQKIFELPTSRLIVSALLQLGRILALLFMIVFIVIAIVSGEMGFLAIALGAGSGVFVLVKASIDSYGTKVYLSRNGLRVRAGLTTLVTRSIPPQRLHAIEIRQPMLWRRADWWQLRAVLAGGQFDLDSSSDAGDAMIIPAGTREDVLKVLWTMLPSAGTNDDATLIRDAFDGSGTGEFFLSAPRKARWLDPITWKSRGICLTPNVAVFRTGRWSRRVVFVWQDHTQSLRMSQGPLQRLFGLGAIQLDLVSPFMDAGQNNMAVEDVERMIWIENDLTAQARNRGVSESIEAWQRRVGLD